MYARSTGVDSLDDALGGLLAGDNVVWLGGADALHGANVTVHVGESRRAASSDR